MNRPGSWQNVEEIESDIGPGLRHGQWECSPQKATR